jgi:hypothetical protein
MLSVAMIILPLRLSPAAANTWSALATTSAEYGGFESPALPVAAWPEVVGDTAADWPQTGMQTADVIHATEQSLVRTGLRERISLIGIGWEIETSCDIRSPLAR